jgi:ankyrin repeat protein
MAKTEAKPDQLPLWVILCWCVIFPGAFLITARFVYEQTFLTWASGAQMVGFTLAHQQILFLLWGSVSMVAAHLWLFAVAVILVKRRLTRIGWWQWTAVGLTAITLGLNYVPYAAWELWMSKIPGSKVTREEAVSTAAFSGQLFLVKMLLPKEAGKDQLNEILFTAANGNQPKLIEYMLSKGATINSSDKDGCTPLSAAAQAGYSNAVTILMVHGADANIADKRGRTPLDYAIEFEHPETADLLRSQGGAKGKGTIFNAAQSCDTAKVKAFLEENPKLLNSQDTWGAAGGRTPLHYAVEHGCTDVVRFLLQAGANVSLVTAGEGHTPLHYAVFKGDKGMVELLLAYGADVNVKDSLRNSPLSTASREHRDDIAELLRQHGAKE